jgi:hypothetical protein
MPIGFTLPFSLTTGSLGILESTRTEVSAVKENLKSLLLTNWGERVMHPDFGCNLIEFLFENGRTKELKNNIAERILSQISKWMPFVSLEELNVTDSNDDSTIPDHVLNIRIKFKIIGKLESTGEFSLSVRT